MRERVDAIYGGGYPRNEQRDEEEDRAFGVPPCCGVGFHGGAIFSLLELQLHVVAAWGCRCSRARDGAGFGRAQRSGVDGDGVLTQARIFRNGLAFVTHFIENV